MNYGEESSRILQKVKKIFEEIYPPHITVEDYQPYIERLKIVEVIIKHRGGTVVLFDRQKFEIIHIIGRLGNNELKDLLNPQYFFDSLTKEHQAFPLIATKWYTQIFEKLNLNEQPNIYINYCGLNIKYKREENNLRLNISTMNFETDKNSPLAIIIINNITHLIKGKGYWFRSSANGRIFSYFSETEQSYEEDIISSREKEILIYISEGMDTKKIAEKLQISPNTVDNHRRNMLARTGARDTTALIQLCQLNGVL